MIAERALDTMKVAAREQVLVAMLGIPRLLRHSVWTTVDTTQGQGLGVLLVPGDHTLSLTSTWLRARGYRPTGAGIGFTVGCTTDLVDKLERRLEAHAETTGGQVVLIGQSRGGTLARLLTTRRPDLVRGLIMLGSPVVEPLNAQRDVMAIAALLTRLSTLGIPGLMNTDCLSGTCYNTNITALTTPLQTPALSIYSRSDAIVPWQCSLDPHAEHLEVHTTHTGMAFDPTVYKALNHQLIAWADSPALAPAC
ncbi:alpha/beta hydrolase family protein [Umezawaea tangerina]|uniref:Alpha/beta hydrolase family protein n=2 Tax=Umezawaea tangerina TaxID=84725 RepID=A0A2T0SYX3_9PSEU|nr:alpha/beta hydrolase family protein [Umezawaea tangerina]